METIAQEAKRLLEPIPEEQWVVGVFGVPNEQKCCAVGHWVRIHSENPNDFSEENCSDFVRKGKLESYGKLREVSIEYLLIDSSLYDITDVNNDPSDSYPQDTPKRRVIALIDDMIKAGF